jgi:hypothetical protein
MIYVTLPCGIDLAVSSKKFLRPDTEADQTTLVPDVAVPFWQDSLDTALSLMAAA